MYSQLVHVYKILHCQCMCSVCVSVSIGPPTEGVGCMDIQLSDEPNLGRWSANARLVIVSIVTMVLTTDQ